MANEDGEADPELPYYNLINVHDRPELLDTLVDAIKDVTTLTPVVSVAVDPFPNEPPGPNSDLEYPYLDVTIAVPKSHFQNYDDLLSSKFMILIFHKPEPVIEPSTEALIDGSQV